MWNKIFLGLFAVALVVMCAMTFWCYNWLGSIDKPETVAANFANSQSLYWTILWISSAVLMIVANVLLWTKKSAWALWATFGFFAVFIILQTWWLNELFAGYAAKNNLAAGFVGMGIVGIILCIITAVGVFFNQFIVFRMRDKMFANASAASAENPVIVENEKVSE
jgi:F0F1-type ATP synthase assembly protein I